MTGTAHDQAAQLLQLGHQRQQLNDTGNAFALYRAALDYDVDYSKIYHNLSSMVMGAGRYDASIALAERALASDPDNWMVMLNLAIALWRAQRYEENLRVLLKARALRPRHFGIEHNLGLHYYAVGKLDLAIEHLQGALRLPPDLEHCRGDYTQGCRNDMAHAVLKSGDLARGLDLLEMRWEDGKLLTKSPIWECGLPQWKGEDWGRKDGTEAVLLLHHEQGFGDTLQFVRFIPEIKARAGNPHIIFAAPKPLHRLFEGQCGIDELIDFLNPGEIVKAARQADYHCPLISAVAVLKPSYETMVAPKSYLAAPFETDRDFHKGGATLAVGVVWAASPGHERSRQRSVPVNELVELGTVPGVRLWSLQFPPFSEDLITTGAEYMIEDATKNATGGLRDFADTAAVLQKLDLVVAVDTAIVHLAGALGKPCFMLNPINPCWRWCKGGAAWYPAMELFDQVTPENWKAPIAQIKERIAAMASERRQVRFVRAGASYPHAPTIILDGKLQLPAVTLILVDTVEHKLTARAAKACLDAADFGGAFIFSDQEIKVAGTKWIKIDAGGLDQAMRATWYDSLDHVKTSHVLIAQWDSWIVNPSSWDDAWLNYDYIGASWHWHKDGLDVGNSGFCLRSTKLMRYLSDHREKYPIIHPDDDTLCRKYRPEIERRGFKWAPKAVADRFSAERSWNTAKPFGFHGSFNWPRVLDEKHIHARIADMTPYAKRHAHFAELTAQLKTVDKVLLCRTGAFGDVLALTPVTRRLREELGPKAVIHVLTDYPDVFHGNADVNWAGRIVNLSDYRQVWDLNDAIETRLHRVAAIECYMEEVFGDRAGDKTVKLAKVPRPYIAQLSRMNGGNRFVTMSPAVSWQNRTLPQAFWQSLADKITASGFVVVVIGTKSDRELQSVVDTRGLLNPREEAAMIEASRCFVGSDSGPMMLMAATETPAVALATISVPESSIFWRHGEANWRVRVMRPDLPCIGCSGRIGTVWRHHGCELGTYACVTAFDAGQVAAAVIEMAEMYEAPAREAVAV